MVMASSCPDQVASWADHGYCCQFGVTPLYYGGFVIIVNVCFGRSTYYKNVHPAHCRNLLSLNLEEPLVTQLNPEKFVRPSVCTCLQIRYWAENGTGPTDLVNYSLKSWIHVSCESEIVQKIVHKWKQHSNNMKLMILKKIKGNSQMFLQPTRSECIQQRNKYWVP